MQLPDTSLIEFRRLYKNRYGIALTQDQAREKATALLRLMRSVFQERARQLREKSQRCNEEGAQLHCGDSHQEYAQES